MTVKESLSNRISDGKRVEYENKDYHRGYCEGYIKGIEEQKETDIKNACDAYCKVCGHFAHTTPIETCRHDCHYYYDFVSTIKGVKRE